MISSEIDCIYFTECGGCKCPKTYEKYESRGMFRKICNFIFFKILRMEEECVLYGHPHKICEFRVATPPMEILLSKEKY